MFTTRKITTIPVAWDCASCGRAIVQASHVIEGAVRVRQQMRGSSDTETR